MRTKLVLLGMVFLSVSGLAAAQVQHHPFSQIFPPDAPLDFGGQNLTNATQIETGSIIANDTNGNITFRDSTGAKTLVWNSNSVRWEVVNSDLDLNDNDVENFFDNACAGNDVVKQVYANGSYNCVDVSTLSTTENLQQTLNEGNWTGGVDINMTDSELLDYFAPKCGTDEAIGQIYPNGSYNCVSTIETGQDVEGLNATLEAGNLANQSINLDDNNIENIGDLTGNNIVNNAQINAGAVDNGSIASFNSFTMQSLELTSDLSGTGIVNSGQISSNAVTAGKIAPGAVTNVKIADAAVNRTQLAQSGCSSDDILLWDGSQWTCTAESNLGTDAQDLSTTNASTPSGASNVVHGIQITGGQNTAVRDYFVPDTTRVGSLNETLAVGNLANQSIVMAGHNIEGPGEITSFFANTCSGSNEVVKRVYANGSYVCDTVPEDEGTESLNATLEAGNLANQSINLDDNNIENIGDLTGNDIVNNAQIASGAVNNDSISLNSYTMTDLELTSDLTGTDIVNSGQINSGAVGSSELGSNAVTRAGGELDSSVAGEGIVYDSGWLNASDPSATNEIQTLDENNGTTPSGASSVDQVIDISDSPNDAVIKDYFVPDTTRVGSLNETLAVGNLANQSIVMVGHDIENPGNITDFFANTCSGANEVVKRVYANGSYVCDTVPEDEGTENLKQTLTAGNIANQSINMSGQLMVKSGGLSMEDGDQNLELNGSTGNNPSGVSIRGGSYESQLAVSGAGGNVRVIGGNSEIGPGGNIEIDGGNSDQGNGGDIYLNAGNGTASDGNVVIGMDKNAQKTTSAIGIGTDSPDSYVDIEAGNLSLSGNAIHDIGSGGTNITSTGKIEAGDDIDASNNNLNDVNSIDGGGDAVRVDNNINLNGNSVTSSSEVCIGDQCS